MGLQNRNIDRGADQLPPNPPDQRNHALTISNHGPIAGAILSGTFRGGGDDWIGIRSRASPDWMRH